MIQHLYICYSAAAQHSHKLAWRTTSCSPSHTWFARQDQSLPSSNYREATAGHAGPGKDSTLYYIPVVLRVLPSQIGG